MSSDPNIPLATTYTKDYDGKFGEHGTLELVTFKSGDQQITNVPASLLRDLFQDIAEDLDHPTPDVQPPAIEVQPTIAEGGVLDTLKKAFPGMWLGQLRWTVSIPEGCDVDAVEGGLFTLDGVDEFFSSNGAADACVEFCVPLEKATPERLMELSKKFNEIIEANPERSDEEE